jgi:hypothetical protein
MLSPPVLLVEPRQGLRVPPHQHLDEALYDVVVPHFFVFGRLASSASTRLAMASSGPVMRQPRFRQPPFIAEFAIGLCAGNLERHP